MPQTPPPPGSAHRPGWPQRWRQRWLQRLPARPVQRLQHRNLYVLPTRPGWMLLGTLLLLLVGAINFQLNLGYALTFLVAGSAAAGVWAAHSNLRGMQLSLAGTPTLWAGRPASLPVQLHAGARARLAIELAVVGAHPPVLLDLPAQTVTTAAVPWTPSRRGRLPAPPLSIATRYPLGLCRVWSWWRPQAEWLVYPAPEPDAPPLPWITPAHPTAGVAPWTAPATDEPPDQPRPWQPGDSPRRVLWKKAAHQADDDPRHWWVRGHASGNAAAALWLDERDCALTDPEAVRARLCAWVLRADAQGLRYGLRVGGAIVPPDHGPAQRLRCLEVLACH
ncbi:MAG: DUF58 domain-containing protein [Tepidimonas sp.]|nr:DUF58 domain-containing protein [Tepidimonas sp.]